MRRRNRAGPLLLLAVSVGCGSSGQPPKVERDDLCRVNGKVTFRDGTPLREGTVVFHHMGEDEKCVLQGTVQEDGSYAVSLSGAEGVPPGAYKVLVVPKPPAEGTKAPPGWPPIDRSFSRVETSRLACTVKPGANVFNITVWK